MLSKILAETKFVQKVFEFKLTNFSKTKTFFIDKYTKHALQNYKIDDNIFTTRRLNVDIYR